MDVLRRVWQRGKAWSLAHPMRAVLVLFIAFVLLVYLPFVFKGGLEYDDWSAAGLSKGCPGLIQSFKCYWPGYPDRPLASAYYSIDSNLFHAWAPGYIMADVLEWTIGVGLIFWILAKRFGLRLATPFLFIAEIPALSSTTIFSPAMQAIGSFTFMVWAISLYCLDRYLDNRNGKFWVGCYVLMLASLFLYESSLPLFGISAFWPLLAAKARPRLRWLNYSKQFILPVVAVLVIYLLYQDLIVFRFYHYITKIRIQNDHIDLFNFGMRVLVNDLYISTIGVANFGVRGAIKLRSFGFWSVLNVLVLAVLAYYSLYITRARTAAGEFWAGRGKVFAAALILIILGVGFIHFIATVPPTIVGYNNRGVVGSSILIALVGALIWQKWLVDRKIFMIIGILCFAAYLASFIIQRDNYISANTRRLQIQAAIIPQLNKSVKPGDFVLADTPEYTPKNFDNETIYSDEVLDWGISLSLETNIKGIRGISLTPGRVTRGDLQITDNKLMVLRNSKDLVPIDTIWYYEVKTNKLEKIQTTQQLSKILKNTVSNPPYSYIPPVDLSTRTDFIEWLASY